MLEKLNISNTEIAECIFGNYGLRPKDITFLPIGNASNTWVYQVTTDSGRFFLKLKKEVSLVSLLIPRYLADSGNDAVVAPLYSKSRQLSENLGNYSVILYPFLDAKTGAEAGLTSAEWKEIGQILKRIHSVDLPPEIKRSVETESFSPFPKSTFEETTGKVNPKIFNNDFQKQLAEIWNRRKQEIQNIFERVTQLGQRVREESLPFVLCHTDLHTSNILVSQERKIFVVDWDAPRLAPKERDLMFILGNQEAEGSFFEGYGKVTAHPEAVAYYRYEWVGQEFLDYVERIFGVHEMGDEVRRDALRSFEKLFAPGDVVEAAQRADVSNIDRSESKALKAR